MSSRITKKTQRGKKVTVNKLENNNDGNVNNDSNNTNSSLENQNNEINEVTNEEIEKAKEKQNKKTENNNENINNDSNSGINDDNDDSPKTKPTKTAKPTKTKKIDDKVDIPPVENSDDLNDSNLNTTDSGVGESGSDISDIVEETELSDANNSLKPANDPFKLKSGNGNNALTDDFFKEEVMTIQNKQVIPEFQRVYQDDTIYKKDLEASLMKLLPLNQQNNIFLQQKVYKEVEELIKLKNYGVEVTERGPGWYKYLGNYRNDIFNASYIVPIVLDKRRVYVKVGTLGDDSEAIDLDDESHIHIDADSSSQGVKLEDPKDLVRLEKTLQDKYAKSQITYEEYYRQLFHDIRPFINSDRKDKGYHAAIKSPNKVVRYFNLTSKRWKNRMALGPLYTNYQVFDEITRERRTERNIILDGEDINVIGFLVLPVNQDYVYNPPEISPESFTRLTDIDRGENSFYRFAEIGKITDIKSGNNAIITVPNHGLKNRSAIMIRDNTSQPTINGCYSCRSDNKTLRVIDENSFTVDLDTSNITELKSDGTVYAAVSLNMEIYNIEKQNVSEKQKETTSPKFKATLLSESKSTSSDEYSKYPVMKELPYGKLYLFDNMKISESDKRALIDTALPSIEDILQIEDASLSETLTPEDVDIILGPYGVRFHDLNKEQTDKLYSIMNKNLKEFKTSTNTSEKAFTKNAENKNAENKNAEKEKFNDLSNPLADKYIQSDLIKKYYSPYISYGMLTDSIVNRINWASRQPDNGNLLYTYATLEISKSIHGDDKKDLAEIEKELKELESQVAKQEKELEIEEKKNKDKANKGGCGSFKLDYSKEYKSLEKRDEDYYKLKANKFIGSSFKNGDYCIIRSNDVYNGEIYVWKDNEWDRDPNFFNERDVCLQEGKKLVDTELDKTTCMYEEVRKCVSSDYYRLYQRLTTNKTMLAGLKDWHNSIKNQTNIKKLEVALEDAKLKLHRFIKLNDKLSQEQEQKFNKSKKGKAANGKNNNNDLEVMVQDTAIGSTDVDFSNELANSNSDNNNNSDSSNKNNSRNRTGDNDIDPIASFDINQYNNPLYNRILTIRNIPIRNRLIYTLIEKDGILIDNWIYSRKYKHPITCGHWDYMRRENIGTSNTEKQAIRTEMLDKFGDRGLASHGVQTCRVCGYSLEFVNYDEAEGLDKSGNIVKRTTIWIPDQHRQERSLEEVLSEQAKKIKDNYTSYRKVDCVGLEFRREMLNLGIRPKQLKDSVFICGRILTLTDKMALVFKYNDLLQVIVDVIRYYDNYIPDLNKFVQLERLKAQKEGKTVDIDRVRQMYPVFSSPFRIGAIVSRLLITLQTAIPPYRHGKMITGCSFAGFDGENGINFMSCLVKETGMMDVKLEIKGKTSMASFNLDNIKEKITMIHDKFRAEFSNIKELYGQHDAYLKEKSTTAAEISLADEKTFLPGRFTDVEDMVLDKFVKELKTATANKPKIIEDLRNDIKEYMANISLDISEMMQQYIESQQTVFPVIPVFPENSCCMASIDNYQNYNLPIDEMTTGELNKAIERGFETELVFQEKIVELGVVSHLYFPEYIRHMRFLDFFNQGLFENLIEFKFLTYCHSGVSNGEKHQFNELEQCIKCQLTEAEIRDKKHSTEEYETLLQAITERNTRYYKPEMPVISGIKTTPLSSVEMTQIERKSMELIDKIFTMLGKDGDTTQRERYEEIMKNLPVYPERETELKNQLEEEKATPKKIIATDVIIEQERLMRLKQYFNEYFRKYVSIVANRYDKRNIMIKIEGVTSDVSQDIQKVVFEEYDQMGKFLIPGYNKIFKKLRFKHNIQDIANLVGIPDIYNRDYTKIIMPSSFSPSQAVNAMMELLLEQLGEFLQFDESSVSGTKIEEDVTLTDSMGDYEEEEVRDIGTKEARKIIAQFILTILDMIDEQKKELDIKYSEIDSFGQRLFDDAKAKRTVQIQMTGVGSTEDIETVIEEEMKDKKIIAEEEDTRKHVTEVIKEELEAAGKEATDAAIEQRIEDMEDTPDEEAVTIEEGEDYGDINENQLEGEENDQYE